MARITTEDCIDYIDSQFLLVAVASKRARQLNEGYLSKIDDDEGDKPTVHALREIAAGKVNTEVLSQPSEFPSFLRTDTGDLPAETAAVDPDVDLDDQLREIILQAEADDAAEAEKKLAEDDD